MELRQLEYFLTVSKLGNFTRAADHLYVTQPTITNAIHNLEEELGIKLFDRKRKVELTADGQFFLARVEEIMELVNQSLLEVNELKNLNKGVIKLGIPPMIGAYLFPGIYTNFKKAYPQVELQVVEEGSRDMYCLLKNGELDLGIIILPDQCDSLHTIPITTEQIVLCAAHYHRLSQAKTVDFNELQDEQFILLKDDSFTRQAVINECRKADFEPHVIFSSNQYKTIEGLVANGVGISFLMSQVAKNSTNFTTVPLTHPMNITIGLAWPKKKAISRATEAFISFVKSYTHSSEFMDHLDHSK